MTSQPQGSPSEQQDSAPDQTDALAGNDSAYPAEPVTESPGLHSLRPSVRRTAILAAHEETVDRDGEAGGPGVRPRASRLSQLSRPRSPGQERRSATERPDQAGSGIGPAARGGSRRTVTIAAAVVAVALLITVPVLTHRGSSSTDRTTAAGDTSGAWRDNTGVPAVDSSRSPQPGGPGHATSSPGTTPRGPGGTTVTPGNGNESTSPNVSSGGQSAGNSGKGPGRDTGAAADTGSSSGGSGTAGGAGGSSPTTAAATTDVQIYNQAAARCFSTVDRANSYSGSGMQISDCQDVPWQHWSIMSDGTVRSQGKCLNVGGGSHEDNAPLSWTNCNGTDAQKFTLTASHTLVNTPVGKCVDLKGQATGNGTRIVMFTCGGATQLWSTRAF